MTSNSNSITFAEIEKMVKDAQKLVQSNREIWEPRFQKYATKILANSESIEKARKKFHGCKQFKFYLTITNAQNTSLITLGVRYKGQQVSKLNIQNGKITMSSTKLEAKNNNRDFKCALVLKDADWRGKESTEFRKYFMNNPERTKDSSKGNNEHRIESMLLTEFSKRKSQDKHLLGIQPVKISGLRISIPTPLKASNHNNIDYSKTPYRGCIDILARVGKSGLSEKLCIIEVKDENNQKEPPNVTVMQAAVYASFIRELLRSDAGADWWKLFEFSNSIPKKLTLLAACAMPSNENYNTSFDEKPIALGEGDELQLHYIYFKEDGKEITNIKTSLNT